MAEFDKMSTAVVMCLGRLVVCLPIDKLKVPSVHLYRACISSRSGVL
jgi:hypothetical protein